MTSIELNDLRTLYDREGQNTVQAIAQGLYGTNQMEKNTAIAAAYVLYKIVTVDFPANAAGDVKSFCESVGADEKRKRFLERHIGNVWQGVTWQGVICRQQRYKPELLKAVILFYEDNRDKRFGGEIKTPESISRLAHRLLDLPDNEVVTDLGFVVDAYMRRHDAAFLFDSGTDDAEIAAMRLEISECSAEPGQYGYVYSSRPLDLRFPRAPQKAMDPATKPISDWQFNTVIADLLRQDGRGVVVMANDSMGNWQEKHDFIQKGYLKAVIALPEKMFDNIGIPTTMLVIDKQGKTGAMFVDATETYTSGRRNKFSDKHIDQIVAAVRSETKGISTLALQNDIAAHNYAINPARYLMEPFAVGSISLGDVMESITRGAPLKPWELDELIAEEKTDNRYLTPANIRDGQVDRDLRSLEGIRPDLRKYCLPDRALVLSKNGMPFKVAVVEVPANQTTVANGNLYIIRIDESKANPYFVKAFLESEKGSAMLKSRAVGAVLPTISIADLKEIQIPDVPIDKQNEYERAYKKTIEKIAEYQRLQQEARKALDDVYADIVP